MGVSSYTQLIESRVSTFQSAIHLSSCLEFIYFGVSISVALFSCTSVITCEFADHIVQQLFSEQKADEGVEKNDTIIPVIYEDKDESEEEESDEAAMETDQESEELEAENGFSDHEGSDSMID